MTPAGVRDDGRRLRVLFLTGWYPTASQPVGGIFVRELAHAAATRVDVAVLHCIGPDPHCRDLWKFEEEREYELSEGLPTYRVACRSTTIPGLSYAIYVTSIFRAMRRIRASGFRPDLIHAHSYEPGFPSVLLGIYHRIPIVISEHYSGFAQNALTSRELLKARWAFAHATRVLPVSGALQLALQGAGVRGRFQIVPNTFDPAVFAPGGSKPKSDGPKRLLFVGRMVPIKRLPDLLRAVARLSASDAWHLDIVGDGPDRVACEHLADKLDITERVTFHGTKTKTEIATLMRNADLFVLPSQWENMPCVLIEAQASGLPIVASSVGGIPEVVNGGTGILVAPGDVPGLADGITRTLARLPSYDAQDLARNAERYSYESVGNLCATIYRDCVRS